jgi:hypothetical protein
MHFTAIKPHVISASVQSNLSFLEDMVRAARSRFAAVLDRFTELRAKPLPTTPSERNSHDNNRGSRVHGLASAAGDLGAIVTVLDRMASELLVESKHLWGAVGHTSGNVHKIAFGRARSPASPGRNEPLADSLDERLKRMSHLVISLLELATMLEEAIADLQPVRTGEKAGNR